MDAILEQIRAFLKPTPAAQILDLISIGAHQRVELPWWFAGPSEDQ